jgi:hypothetical protein
MMHRQFYISFQLALLVGFSLASHGCFPERFPVEPESYENRRPTILLTKPNENEEGVNDSASVEIWFDELMNAASLEQSVSLELVKNAEDETNEEWSFIDSIASFGVSPSNPQMMFIGLGALGAMQSENGGETWKFLRAVATERVTAVRYHPLNSQILLAIASSQNLLRSTDGGNSWQKATGLPDDSLLQITALEFDVATPQNVWLGVQ